MKYIVLVDIDGTIAEVHPERLEMIKDENKDWDAFYKACHMDEPIKDVISIIDDLVVAGNSIVLCTGRSEICRVETMKWLSDNDIEYSQLLMRKEGDFRHDIEVKPELLHKNMISKEDILMVFEDRNSMVEKWRELGLTVAQVAKGDF